MPWIVLLDEPMENEALERAMVQGSVAAAELARDGALPDNGAYLLEGIWQSPIAFKVMGFVPVTDGPPPPDVPLSDFCRARG